MSDVVQAFADALEVERKAALCADFETPAPVNRTLTPFTGFRDRVTFATSPCLWPFAFTSFVLMVRTRHRFGFGFGFGVGFTGGVNGGVTG